MTNGMAPPAAMHAGQATRVPRSTRISAAAADRGRTDDVVCGLGRPGHVCCDARTASPNHARSRPDDGRPVAYSTRVMPARALTPTARPRPAHTRRRDGRPDCAAIAAASTASHTAVHGIICGQLKSIRVSRSIRAAQPTHVMAARATATTKAIRLHQATSFRHASGPGLSIGCPFLPPRPRNRQSAGEGMRCLGAKGHQSRGEGHRRRPIRRWRAAHQPPSGACNTTAVCASTVSAPPPGTSSAGVSSSGPVNTTSCQAAPNSFGGKVNSIGS